MPNARQKKSRPMGQLFPLGRLAFDLTQRRSALESSRLGVRLRGHLLLLLVGDLFHAELNATARIEI